MRTKKHVGVHIPEIILVLVIFSFLAVIMSSSTAFGNQSSEIYVSVEKAADIEHQVAAAE